MKKFEENQTLFDSLYEGFFLITAEGSIKWTNKKGRQLLGKSPNMEEGINFFEVVHDLFKSQLRELLQKSDFEYFEKELVLVLGKDFIPVLAKFTKQNDDTVLINLLDLTNTKLIEERLFELSEQINAIITTAVDGIITIDERGTIETVNPVASELFGYEPKEIIGKNIRVLMPEPDKSKHDTYMANYQKTRQAKIIGIGREVTGLKKNGEKFPFSLGVSEVKLKKRVIYTGIIHDLTQQKLVEEKLRRAVDELGRSNRELEDFAYVSSHDLQEPLRKIQAFGDRIKTKEYQNLTEKGRDYLDRLLNASHRMQVLINDLLSFSRVSTRAKPFINLDLNAVAKEVLLDLEILIEQTNAKVEVENLPTIEADPTQMRQLFQNLITNAIKFVEEGKTPQVKIFAEKFQRKAHLDATPGDTFVELNFKDNGIGIEEKFVSKIFNIFSRLEGRKYKGSGIGLSICKKIVSRHGGDINVSSKPNEGTTFIIKLATKQTA